MQNQVRDSKRDDSSSNLYVYVFGRMYIHGSSEYTLSCGKSYLFIFVV